MRMWGVRRCSGAAVAGAAPADFIFGEERTAADGTAAVQLAVSVVCGDGDGRGGVEPRGVQQESGAAAERGDRRGVFPAGDRKSTRLNSSHVRISYAVFCLKKNK